MKPAKSAPTSTMNFFMSMSRPDTPVSSSFPPLATYSFSRGASMSHNRIWSGSMMSL